MVFRWVDFLSRSTVRSTRCKNDGRNSKSVLDGSQDGGRFRAVLYQNNKANDHEQPRPEACPLIISADRFRDHPERESKESLARKYNVSTTTQRNGSRLREGLAK
ncbi:unnamed protein product [Amoebophrya sp. A25]|nr:unnamed protein product [Amoebophrya sp. A25]|eukprot:GSA25T00027383001.1